MARVADSRAFVRNESVAATDRLNSTETIAITISSSTSVKPAAPPRERGGVGRAVRGAAGHAGGRAGGRAGAAARRVSRPVSPAAKFVTLSSPATPGPAAVNPLVPS